MWSIYFSVGLHWKIRFKKKNLPPIYNLFCWTATATTESVRILANITNSLCVRCRGCILLHKNEVCASASNARIYKNRGKLFIQTGRQTKEKCNFNFWVKNRDNLMKTGIFYFKYTVPSASLAALLWTLKKMQRVQSCAVYSLYWNIGTCTRDTEKARCYMVV